MCRSRIVAPIRPISSRSARSSRSSSRGSRTPARRKLGQNLKYDEHVLANPRDSSRGDRARHAAPVVRRRVASPARHGRHGAAPPSVLKTIKYEDVCGKGVSQIGFDEVALEQAADYAAEDADITLRLHQYLYPLVAKAPKLLEVYRDIEMPVARVLWAVERNGVLIDAQRLQDQSGEIGAKLIELEAKAHELAGGEFNLNSPKQIGEIFFEKLKLPVVKKTPSGSPSTDEEVLQKLAEDYPLPKVLLDYRGLSKLKSTYTDKLPKMINAQTGRVHTNYAQAVAGDRAPRVERSQPAEHSCTHARGPPDSRSVRCAAGQPDHVGRLLADRVADHGAYLGRRESAACVLPRGRIFTARRPARSSVSRRPM